MPDWLAIIVVLALGVLAAPTLMILIGLWASSRVEAYRSKQNRDSRKLLHKQR